MRFLADVYGRTTIDKLEEKERTATAKEVVEYLCGWNRFRIGEYTSADDKGQLYTRKRLYKRGNFKDPDDPL